MRLAVSAAALAAAAVLCPAAAAASDDAVELWLNPSASYELSDGTAFELETAQRFRSASDGREDTYYARLWLNRDLSDAITISGGVERRVNDPGSDETRLLQQVSARRGVFRTRLRLEQRFVEDGRTGLRVRPRAGVELPVGGDDRLLLLANAEAFLTVRSTSAGGDTGLTGLRTQFGAAYQVSERLSVTLTYLRQQTIADRGPDEVGHAPFIGVELSL